jgi:hypothetical protein
MVLQIRDMLDEEGKSLTERSVFLIHCLSGCDPHAHQLLFNLPGAIALVCFGKLCLPKYLTNLLTQAIQLTGLSTHLFLQHAHLSLVPPILISAPVQALPPPLLSVEGRHRLLETLTLIMQPAALLPLDISSVFASMS